MKISRRSFIGLILAGSATTFSFLALNSLTQTHDFIDNRQPRMNMADDQKHIHIQKDPDNPLPNEGNMALGMVIDTNKCDGCVNNNVYSSVIDGEEPRCTSACRVMHNVPPSQEWIKVYYNKTNPMNEGFYFPRPCMQCQRPPCVQVCPVGAAIHRPLNHDGTGPGDGLVLIKYQTCIGCRTCMAACPYEVRYFNWAKYNEPNREILKYHNPMYATKRTLGTVEKCDFCAHLGYGGKLAACVQACPNGAIYYGNLKQNVVTNSFLESIQVQETITARTGYRMKEELGTRPRVYYLPKKSN